MATITLSKRSARNLAPRLDRHSGAELVEAAGKMHKYQAETDLTQLVMDVYQFDSVAELERYAELKMLKQAGLIWDIIVHPKYRICIRGIYICDVELDFEYVDDEDNIIYEEVKGFDTAVSRLKRKMVEAAYGIKVKVIR